MDKKKAIHIVRSNYDNLINTKQKITRTDLFLAFANIINELDGKDLETAPCENKFVVVIKEGKKDAYTFREIPAYAMGMISDIRWKILYNEEGYKKELQIDKYQLVSVEGI